MLLHDFLFHANRFSGGRTAIVDGPVTRSYAEVGRRVRRAAAGLHSLGIAPGHHVAILASNGAFFYEAYFACSLAGLVAVPINTRLSAPEIDFILEDADCRAVLFDDNCAGLLSPGHDRVLITETAPSRLPAAQWEALITTNAPLFTASNTISENDIAHICYTGGTTGRPKGVMLSHRNIVASTFNKIMLGSFARDDVWLHAAPMFHQADSWACFAFTALGAKHLFLPKFDPLAALDLIEKHGVTALQLVPTMLLLMLETPGAAKRNFTSIRRILYGSAPMPVDVLRRCQQAFRAGFQHIYGLTEAAGTVAATPWPSGETETGGARFTSCGQPIAGVDMRIADGAGTLLPADSIGRIQVRGANVMRGYWRRPNETAEAFVDGWLDTGDIGRMDEDGFVFIVDRAKDMIITGGENVYSTEVENVLHHHPAVLEAAVIGLTDEKWGEAVTAVVVARPDHSLGAAELIAHCREYLAGYKCPKAIVFRDSLPKSGAGKILKAELRSDFLGADPNSSRD